VVSGVRRMNEVKPARAPLVYTWMGDRFRVGWGIPSQCATSNRLTQPCIPPGWLHRVPALLGVKAGMSHLPGV